MSLLSQGLKSLENLVRRLLEGDQATDANASPMATEVMEWLLDSVFMPRRPARKAQPPKPETPPALESGAEAAGSIPETDAKAKNTSNPTPQDGNPATGNNSSANHRRGTIEMPMPATVAASGSAQRSVPVKSVPVVTARRRRS